MEQPVRADHAVARRSRTRAGKRAAPYFLALPGGLWLAALFLVPLIIMLSLSLQTGDPLHGYTLTWHFAEFGQVLSQHHTEFVRSIYYAAAATVICLIVSFPLAYWIAFHGGTRKNFFLLMLLLPFFVSFVIRSLAWQFLLSDNGILLGTLKNLHLLPQDFHVLATSTAVIAGIAYNYLPFTALPLYVSLERIDPRVMEAAGDLFANRRQVFMKVVFPLCIPGIFAAFLLTFVPAVGDYLNQQILGGVSNTMIGTIIQTQFLVNGDYAGASALSAILLAGVLFGIFLYARLLGSRTIEEYI
ncbi:MAG TPA: ABC transporter permease [Actinomycetota bacterium]